MKRHIFFGDVHGCFDEVSELLSRLRVTDDDVVVATGDLTRKGPAADRCVELWRDRGYLTVLGNNDLKMIERAGRWRSMLARRSDRVVLRRGDLIDEIARWPLVLDFAEPGVTVVHGGVMPDGSCPREAALELRFVRRDGDGWRMVPKGKEKDGDRFWSEVWDGERIVIYGHTPRERPKLDRRAIGLDTGCVYGGSLTAAVFESPGAWTLTSVRARRAYAR
ncbi:MAG TPA: metallophosphoesterase [Thermoanaerobaculia bacterium]|nr:metallophosphoesterase [Thermoanaerobaculia bacterium]